MNNRIKITPESFRDIKPRAGIVIMLVIIALTGLAIGVQL